MDDIQDSAIYNNIVKKNDIYAPLIDKALKIVENFIIERQLILVGGMAIDMALRKKGSKIYADDEVPDYDFLSPTFHKDAYDLGSILCKDFDNISVIGARHPSTMRVRLNFISVADITYMPKNIFDKLETLDYGKLRIINPSFQFIDQHKSLSVPYENPPQETILQRWTKDMKRYDLLYEHYPLTPSKVNLDKLTYITYIMPPNVIKGQCLTGIPALIYWIQLATNMGFTPPDNINKLTASKITAEVINVFIPSDCMFSIYSDNLWHLLKITNKIEIEPAPTKKTKLQETLWYNAFIDKLPRKVVIRNRIEIFDNNGTFRSSYKPWKDANIWISNIQSIMVYLLSNNVMDPSNKLWIFFYNICRMIIIWASDSYYDSADASYIKFLPNAETYGAHNWPDIYLLNREDFMIRIEEMERHVAYKPKNAYPTKDKPIKRELYEFVPEESPIYQFDGKKTKKFDPIKLIT